MANLNDFPIELFGGTGAIGSKFTKKEMPVLDQATEVVDLICSRGVDITEGYTRWRDLGFAFSDEFGEEGRALFHRLSQQNAQYDERECDKQYSACLNSNGSGIHIATFFKLAKDAGIEIKSAKNATMPSVTNTGNTAKNDDFDDSGEGMSGGIVAFLAQSCTGETFSDKLKSEDLPSFLLPVLDSQPDAVGRDKMLLGTLNQISGVLPDTLYSIYDRRRVYAPLYNIVWGRFATSKGDLEVIRQILQPIKQEMRREYEARKQDYIRKKADWDSASKKDRGEEPKEPVLTTPFVSANASASAVYRTMDANGGWGVMFETEADTLTNMLSKSEYGDYSDLLRKAHHHETISMVRVTDRINIEIENPRLSVFLTCTGSQIPLLLPSNNVANGLASRFLFYGLPDAKVEFRDVFEGSDNPIEDVYRNLGQRLMCLYHALKGRAGHPIQFIMSKAQQKLFVETFNDVLKEQFSMLGDGIQGFIFRLALECYRYAMILTVLRRLSDWDAQDSLFDDDEQALICDERDFNTALTIVNCLVNHTGRVYNVLGAKDEDPFAKAASQPSESVKKYYTLLPDSRTFTTCEALEIASKNDISKRNASRMIGDMVTRFQVLDHPKYATYCKKQHTYDS